MAPEVRLTRPNDINIIRDLDIKCYDYPLEVKRWKELVEGSGKQNKSRVVIVEGFRKPLGFAVWRMSKPEPGVDETFCFLYRIGVRQSVRNNGIGTMLLKTCEQHACRMQADYIRCIVPDFKCAEGDPDDVSGFLTFNGFSATGKIIEEYEFMYGRMVDGFVFEKQMKGVLC